MRVYGRVPNGSGGKTWVVVQTDSQGFNDYVYATALCQALLLNLNESPFYGNFGIPAHPSVISQVFPDYYVMLTQQNYARFFASLLITKQSNPTPTYNVAITTHQGVQLEAQVAV